MLLYYGCNLDNTTSTRESGLHNVLLHVVNDCLLYFFVDDWLYLHDGVCSDSLINDSRPVVCVRREREWGRGGEERKRGGECRRGEEE